MSNVIIIIPVYKTIPTPLEELSFIRCTSILKDFPVSIIAPDGLNTEYYRNIYPQIKTVYFSGQFFNSISGYNKLMLSTVLYKSFSSYKFMLIHQLDAYIFSDELEEWCNKDFDYIGGYVHKLTIDAFTGQKEFIGLNGGLSLRKVSSMLKVLRSCHSIIPFNKLVKGNIASYTGWKKCIGLAKALKYHVLYNNTWYPMNGFDRNEDIFWGYYAPALFKWYKTATPEDSLKFSFDQFPEKSYILNNKNLPFACHAIDKNKEFWKNIINFDQ